MRIPATSGLCFALVIPAILLYMAGMAEAQLACHQCHGSEAPTDSRPLDASSRDAATGGFRGNHRTHIPPEATHNSCSVCHSGNDSYTSSHRNGSIEMSSNINLSALNAVYRNGSSGFPQTSTPKLGNCSNVNCHFERTTLNWGESKLTVPEGCGTCHGAPPAGGDSGAAGSHITHDRYYQGANGCSQCHNNHLSETAPFSHATTAARRPLIITLRDPQGSLKGTYDGPLQDYLPKSQNNQFGSCRATYCHSNGTSVSAQTSFSRISSPAWGAAAGTVTCDACHSYPPAYPNDSKANRHGRHNYFGYSCSRCHYSTTNDGTTISDPTRHVNRQYNVDAPPGESLSYTYNASGGSCGTSYCHSSAQGINNPTEPPIYATVSWNYQLNPGCNSCHRAGYHPFGTGFEMGSGSHAKHLRYFTARGCAACHFTALDQGRDTTCWQCHVAGSYFNHVDQSTRGPEHVNGVIDVAIHPNFPNPGATGSYSGDGIPGTAYGTCSDLYCHSQGTSGNAPFPAANMPSVPWGGQPMPADCTGCHNGDQYSGLPMATGSHGSHLRFDCIRCHKSTVTGNRSTIENGVMAGNSFYPELSRHGNGTVEVSFNPSLGGTYAGNSSKPVGTAYGSCLNVYCHSPGTSVATGSVMAGYSSPLWGTSRTLACDACHGNPPLYPDTRPKANDHEGSHAGMNCSLCHYLTTADGTTITSPAKHADQNYDVSPAPGTQFTYIFAANGGSCGTVSCHAENIIPRKWNSTLCNNCHSTPPSDTAHLRHFTGTSRLAAYGNLSSNTSITYNCGTCHPVNSNSHQDNITQVELYDPAAPAGTRKSLQPATANYTAGTCNNTYCHSPGTNLATGSTPVSSIAWNASRLSCAGCHGYPPAYANGTPKSNSHAAHTGFGCNACHAAVTTTGTTVSNPLRHIDGLYDVTPPGGNGFTYSFATSGGGCSSLSCHSDGTAISTHQQVPAAIKATWGGPSIPCTGCHAMPPLYGNNSPKSNSHASHAVYGCQACHYLTTTDGTTITNRSRHANGTYDVAAAPGVPFTPEVLSTYTNCYFNSGCHNNGTDIATGKTVAWNSSFWGRGVLPYGCASCHGMPPAYANGTPKANSHVSHIGYGCQECHYTVTTNGSSIGTPARHADQQYDIAPGSGRSFSFTFSSTGSSCAAVTCHHDGTFVATAIRSNSLPLTAWGTALGCTGCHGNPPAYLSDAPKKNSHQGSHAALGCQACHLTVTTNGTAITTPAKHGNDVYDVGNGSSFTYTFSTSGSSCSSISCHSDGTVVLTGILRSATTAGWGGPALGCTGCHGNPPAYPSYNPKRNSHLGGHATFGCQVCHYSVTTNGSTITTPANHKNNAYEVSPGPTGSFSYDGNGICSSVVCHDDGTRITTGIARSSGTAPQWGWSTLYCGNCHSSYPDYPNGAPKANSHPRHVSSAGNQCQYCHADTTSNGSSISNPAKHKNGSFDLQGGSGQSFSYTYSSSGGSCSVISCHGDGTAVATGIVRSPVAATWGGAALACNSCHDTPPDYANGTPKKNSHLQHDSFGCQRCHYGTTSNGTSVYSYYHSNNAYDIAGQPPVTISYTYAASGGSCTATCHGNGTQVVTGIRQGGYTPVWGGANPGCTGCHGIPPTYQDGTPKANSHVAHGSYGCKVCHASVVSDNSTISDRTRHGNSSYDLQSDGSASFDYTFRMGGSSCANVSCHTIAPASTNWSMYAQAPASLTPANGSTSQPVTAAITAVFGEEMDPATINATTFKVTDGVSDVAGDVSYDTQTRTATFTPAGGLLDHSNSYTATVTNGIRNARGATFPLASYSWSFGTARSANYQAVFITNFGIKGKEFATYQNFNNAPYIGEDYWKLMAYYNTGYVALPGMTDNHVKVMEATKANAELRSSVTDLSQYQSGTLTFTYNLMYSSPSVADVDVSINGTAGPWTNIWRKSNPYYPGYNEINTVSLNITPLIKRQPNVVIRFRFTPSTPGNGGYWAVDNISLYGDHN